MKTIADLRDTLFATIEAVKAGSMDVEKAKVINDVSKTIVDTAKVEVDYFRVVGEGNSAFLPPVGRQPQLPSSPAPRRATASGQPFNNSPKGVTVAEHSSIEWCDHTFNPWEGCQRIGPGCDHCYAETRNARFGGGQAPNWGPGAPRRRTSEANWRKPLQWQAHAAEFKAQHGRRQRVFCASLADVFDNQVPDAWRRDLFALIAATPDLDWLLLTKRIGSAHRMLPPDWVAAPPGREIPRMPDNVWIGATITSQEEADRDIPKLLAVPARVRFLSMEPLLGPVDLTSIRQPLEGESYTEGNVLVRKSTLDRGADRPAVDWVIVGGESGPGARSMHPYWARSLRDQCAAAGVPFLFKQWGNWRAAAWFDGPDADRDEGDDCVDLDRVDHQFLAIDGRTWDTNGGRHMYPPMPLGHWCLMVNEGKRATGRLLDGIEHNGFPESLAANLEQGAS